MKKIALINDLSGLGKCSLTAAIPVISVMGIQACPLPTAVLSQQTGFDSYYCDDYTDRMDYFTNEWKKMEIIFDGICSGFLAGPKQIQKVLYFLDQFKTADNLYVLDPVMGDHGKTAKIFSEELLRGMKELAFRADVITPNLTELCLLTGGDYENLVSYKNEADYTERIKDLCIKLIQKAEHNQRIAVTGIVRQKDGIEYMGNLVVAENEYAHIEMPYVNKSFSGTGDLFTSVVAGSLIKEESLTAAVQKATDFLQTAIEEAAAQQVDSRHGILFEKHLYKLL